MTQQSGYKGTQDRPGVGYDPPGNAGGAGADGKAIYYSSSSVKNASTFSGNTIGGRNGGDTIGFFCLIIMLTDFITIYENALSNEYCEKWIDYINTLREQGLVLNETAKTHERDHEVINFANDDSFDLRSSDKLSRAFLPSIKPCVDQYLQDYSVLGDGKFLMYDVKAKEYRLVVDSINGTTKMLPIKLLIEVL